MKKKKKKKKKCIVPDLNNVTEMHLLLLLTKFRDPIVGISIQDRKWRRKTFKSCFIGTEAVDWLIKKENNVGVKNRKEAIQLGQILLDRGVFHHVCDDHEFVDDYKFFRFYSEERKFQKDYDLNSTTND